MAMSIMQRMGSPSPNESPPPMKSPQPMESPPAMRSPPPMGSKPTESGSPRRLGWPKRDGHRGARTKRRRDAPGDEWHRGAGGSKAVPKGPSLRKGASPRDVRRSGRAEVAMLTPASGPGVDLFLLPLARFGWHSCTRPGDPRAFSPAACFGERPGQGVAPPVVR